MARRREPLLSRADGVVSVGLAARTGTGVAIGIFLVLVASVSAGALDHSDDHVTDSAIPASPAPAPTAEPGTLDPGFGGIQGPEASPETTIAEFGAVATANEEEQSEKRDNQDDVDPPTPVPDRAGGRVEPKQPAGRDNGQVSAEPLCAVESDGSAVLAADGTVVVGDVKDDTSLEANAELLAAIVALNTGNSDAASSGQQGKLPKSPAHASRMGKIGIQVSLLAQVEQVDQEAVHELFAQIRETEKASDGIPVTEDRTAAIGGCQTEYVCGAERVDDIILGRIDSETPAAYADYVVVVADELDATTAGIRAVESNPVLSNGEVAPVIPTPSSSEGIQSLRGVLAERGLGVEPEGLFVPVFNYCRIGDNGPIEIAVDAEEAVRPSFTWTPLIDEFDYPGASDDLVDRITRTLNGRLPQMQTIPPMDTGVTVVQFPMWLWLEDPLVFTELEAVSDLGTVRVRGRATIRDVTWTLGDEEFTCTLDEMRAFVPGGDADPTEDIPTCHHIFTELVDYTMTATINYVVEEDVANRLSPDYPWPPDNWRPHPRTPFVGITSTSPPMQVCGIGVVNVAFDADVSELQPFCGAG